MAVTSLVLLACLLAPPSAGQGNPVESPPFVERYFDELHEEWRWRGLCIDVLEEVSAMARFNYTLYEVKDGMYGSVDENHEWNGLIKELITGEADVAIGDIPVDPLVENVIDFTVPFYDGVGTAILMKKYEIGFSPFKFLLVFWHQQWGIIIVGTYFGITICLGLLNLMARRWYHADKDGCGVAGRLCWSLLSFVTPHGPTSIARLMASFWWILGFIVVTAFVSGFFTVAKLSPIGSFADLARQSQTQFAPVEQSWSYTYLRDMADSEQRMNDVWNAMKQNQSMPLNERQRLQQLPAPISENYMEMWRRMQEAGFPKTIMEGINRVQSSNGEREFALIGSATVLRYAELTHCDLQLVGEEIYRRPLAFAVQQSSPLRDTISKAILELLNSGKLKALSEKWWASNPNRKTCGASSSRKPSFRPWLRAMGGIAITVVILFVVSAVLIGVERCCLNHFLPEEGEKPGAQ